MVTECPVLVLNLGEYCAPDTNLVLAGKNLLRAILEPMVAQVPKDERDCVAEGIGARTNDRFNAEAKALASLHDSDWRDIMLANISYDLLIASMGCSTIALPSADGPIVARNMDWPEERLIAKASCVIRCMDKGKLKYAHGGWTASMGVVTGFSANGFGLVLNAVESQERCNAEGYPVLLFLRTVLEDATGFEDALRMLTEQKLACSGLITLVGDDNEQRVVVERTPTRCVLRWAEKDKPLLTTNHYRSFQPPEDCPRYERMKELLGENQQAMHDQPAMSNERLLAILTDKGVIQDITAQHVFFSPRKGRMRMFVPDFKGAKP